MEQQELADYGLPSAVVRLDQSFYLASDPPVQISVNATMDLAQQCGSTEWVTFAREISDVEGLCRVAREMFGPGAAPVNRDRWPLRGEVADDEPRSQRPHWRFQLAAPQELAARFELLGAGPQLSEPVFEWFADAGRGLALRLARGYEALGGQVDWHDTERPPEQYAMVIDSGDLSVRGRSRQMRLDEAGWARFAQRVQRGQVTSYGVSAAVWREIRSARWGGMDVHVDLGVVYPEVPPSIRLHVSEEMLRLVGRESVVDSLRQLVQHVPVEHGVVTYGRRAPTGPWAALQRLRDGFVAPPAGVFDLVETVSGPHGAEVAWLQVTEDMKSLTPQRAARAGAFVGAQ